MRDGDDVMLLNIDSVVGLPDTLAAAVSAVGLPDSKDDSSAKNVLIALPLPPLTLPLAAVTILLTVGFLRGCAFASPKELCFGEQSRDDDMVLVYSILLFSWRRECLYISRLIMLVFQLIDIYFL